MHVRVRIIDTTAGPGTTTRATVLHARTLEFYRQAGVADECLKNGVEFAGLNLWVNGRHATRAQFGDLGEYLSRFSFVLVFPQDKQERMLVAALERLSVHVERQTELLSFEQSDSSVIAQLRSADGTTSTCSSAYIAGSDGAHSKVREQMGTGLPGGDYSDLFYVADIEGSGPAFNGEVNIALDDADFLVVFPMEVKGSGRLIGAVRRDVADPTQLEWKDVNARAIERLKVNVTKVRWFSTYRVHHRVAGAFRNRSAFLLGDAAHLHSPVGGRGMNTGIGDAMNLAWKLAGVLRNRIDPAVLDSYETERIAFARRLVATTDRAFAFVTARGRFAKFVRTRVFPLVLPLFVSFLAFRRLMFRTISQISIRYPGSWLSDGEAGAMHAGDRLPWATWRDADGTAHDNYEPFASFDWQLHCYGEASPAVHTACASRAIALHEFPWRPEMKKAGLVRDAIYLVRPDEYVGFASASGDAVALNAYLQRRQVRSVTVAA
jgi:2-polyprenyl-6-methoxyphenol hydroxylase-like FAD-dependent oxidoreductase